MVLKFLKMFDAADTKLFFFNPYRIFKAPPFPQSFKTTYGS